MKKIVLTLVAFAAFALVLSADDRPVSYNKLPSSAKEYIQTNFPGESASVVLKDDDLIFPDYTVVLTNGIKLEFEHSGVVTHISSVNGVPAELIPEQIRDYVKTHYPDAGYLEFEIGRYTYEVKLTNRMELKFSSSFHVIELDD